MYKCKGDPIYPPHNYPKRALSRTFSSKRVYIYIIHLLLTRLVSDFIHWVYDIMIGVTLIPKTKLLKVFYLHLSPTALC